MGAAGITVIVTLAMVGEYTVREPDAVKQAL